MKYAIDGFVNTIDGSAIISGLNGYFLYRLEQVQETDVFRFTVWLNTLTDKELLLTELQTFMSDNALTGYLEWHECHHDEVGNVSECVVAERINF